MASEAVHDQDGRSLMAGVSPLFFDRRGENFLCPFIEQNRCQSASIDARSTITIARIALPSAPMHPTRLGRFVFRSNGTWIQFLS
jgi:hypothetical protein